MEEFNVETLPGNLLVRQSSRKQEKKQVWQNVPVPPQLPTKSHYSSNIFSGEDYGKNFGNGGSYGHSKTKTNQGRYLKTVTTNLFENKPTYALCEWET